MPSPLPVRAVHHVARLTKRLEASRKFYCDVLGFREIERANFKFPGAWLYSYGVQIHLIVNDAAPDPASEIQTRVNHLALHVDDIERTEALLREHGIAYRVSHVADTDIKQLFFADPDGHYIEAAHYPPTPRFLDDSP